MSKSLQYVKILNALHTAGRAMTVEEVKAIEGIVPTRLSTYLWEIKKYSGYSVKSNRNGRTVVSYELVGAGTIPTPVSKPVKVKATPAPKAVKAPKAPKAPKVVKAAPVVAAAPAVVKDDKIVDILDEMDTDVASFEDREFAAEFVRSL